MNKAAVRRAIVIAALSTKGALLTAPLAYAAGTVPMDAAPGALSWIDVKDSHGISIWNYQMAIDAGGATAPDKVLVWFILGFLWEGYRAFVGLSFWLFNLILKAEWLSWIQQPLEIVATGTQTMMEQLGLGPFLLVVAAAVGGMALLRGRIIEGLWKLISACLVVVLSTGLLASPVQNALAPDGWAHQAITAGQDITVAVQTNGQQTVADPNQSALVASMVDTFFRQPTEIVNFGETIDGTKCEKTYNDALQANKSAKDIREAIKKCDGKYKGAVDSPGLGAIISQLVLGGAAVLVLCLLLVIAAAVLLSVAYMAYAAIKVVFFNVIGILPGAPRRGLAHSLAEICMAFLMMIAATVFLSIVMMIVQAIFGQKNHPRVELFLIVDLVTVLAGIVWVRSRKQQNTAREQLGRLFSKLLGAPEGPMPQPIALRGGPISNAAAGLARGAGEEMWRRRPRWKRRKKQADDAEDNTEAGTALAPTGGEPGGGRGGGGPKGGGSGPTGPRTWVRQGASPRQRGFRQAFHQVMESPMGSRRSRRMLVRASQTEDWKKATKAIGRVPVVGAEAAGVMKSVRVAGKFAKHHPLMKNDPQRQTTTVRQLRRARLRAKLRSASGELPAGPKRQQITAAPSSSPKRPKSGGPRKPLGTSSTNIRTRLALSSGSRPKPAPASGGAPKSGRPQGASQPITVSTRPARAALPGGKSDEGKERS